MLIRAFANVQHDVNLSIKQFHLTPMETATSDSQPSTVLAVLRRWFQLYGRSLLWVVLGIYVPLHIFVAIALQVWQIQGGLDWDVAILTAIHTNANPTLDALAPHLTRLGSVWVVLPIAAVIATLLLLRQRWRAFLFFVLTLLGCALINRIGKEIWHRARPTLWESSYPLPTDFSFPSGHAMTSMVFVAALLGLPLGSRWRRVVLFLGGIYAITVGWTRLYLGVHYPSDIVAGWMVAIAWAVGIYQLVYLEIGTPKTIEQPRQHK